MPYDENLADRVQRILQDKEANFYDKKMFGGLCFMVDDKMCIGVMGNKLMCRVGPNAYQNALSKQGCEIMDFTGRPVIGYVYVYDDVLASYNNLAYWIDLCLTFNPEAKKSKKRKK